MRNNQEIQDRLYATKIWGLKFHPKYKYCVNSEIADDGAMQRDMREKGFILKYYDGCFAPFLIRRKVK